MMKKNLVRNNMLLGMILAVLLVFFSGCDKSDHRFVLKTAFKDTNSITITFAGKIDEDWATQGESYIVYEKADPDIRLKIKGVAISPDRRTSTLTFDRDLDQNKTHILKIADIRSDGRSLGPAILEAKKLYLGFLFSVLIGAMLIHNFVFTKYLGLCVFFGTSQKKSTAVGMGITFTIVIVFSSMLSWLLYQYVLKPYRLDFLQIVVFIGLVSLTVQAVDTILRKVNPVLFKAFGVYLVLVIANCIIIAVPLILADNEYNGWESLMLSFGAGIGFLIALFLMSSVRERLELANVPPTYRGLPIAFVVAGLFALSFMGFSGMSIF
jgi:electron transport complex protein RnfA